MYYLQVGGVSSSNSSVYDVFCLFSYVPHFFHFVSNERMSNTQCNLFFRGGKWGGGGLQGHRTHTFSTKDASLLLNYKPN